MLLASGSCSWTVGRMEFIVIMVELLFSDAFVTFFVFKRLHLVYDLEN